jgi:predicted ABC-type ATPase
MHHQKLYIISGCNGAGKTTASFNILPDILECREFVNADEIARGVSPFHPESVAIQAGKIMINRVNELIDSKIDFAFETTLSTRSFKKTIEKAKGNGYYVSVIYFWLESFELAKSRVLKRVSEGGHNIAPNVIERRYKNGIKNLFTHYLNSIDYLMIYDNSNVNAELIAEKELGQDFIIYDDIKFNLIKRLSHEQ